MADESTLLTTGATPEAEAPAAATSPVAPGDGVTVKEVTPDDWRPEALRGEKALEKYKSPEDAFKALVEAQKLIGKRAEGIIPPGADAKPEEIEAFNAKLRELRGVPTEDKIAEAYSVAPPDDAPEGYALDPNFVGAMQRLAFDAGMSPAEFQKQSAGFMAWEIGQIAKMRQESKERQDKAEAALVKEWREAGEVPKEKFTHALQAAKALGLVGKDGKDNILGHLGNNTALIKALADNVWPLVNEGKLKGGGVEDNGPSYTQKEALAKLRTMQSDERYKNPMKRDPDYVREVDAFAARYGSLIRKGA